MSQQTLFGIHAVTSAIEQGVVKRATLLIAESRHDLKQVQLLKLARQHHIAVKRVDKSTLNELTGVDHHQGVALQGEVTVLTYHEQDLSQLQESAGEHCLFLVLDGVQDPHNLGACLRTADAAGVTAVIIPKDKSCSVTPVVRKVASGAAETVPLITVTNLSRTLKQLKQAGCWTVGLAGEATESLYEMDLKGPIAIVMGAEGDGLRRLTKENCDFLAHLPMQGSVSSLNVSVATGVVLYEVLRQRL